MGGVYNTIRCHGHQIMESERCASKLALLAEHKCGPHQAMLQLVELETAQAVPPRASMFSRARAARWCPASASTPTSVSTDATVCVSNGSSATPPGLPWLRSV